MKYLISHETAQALIAYLQEQRYADVFQLIAALVKLERIEPPPPPVEAPEQPETPE